MTPPPARNRLHWTLACAGVIVAGLLSRRFPEFLQAFLGKYPGDALWAVMVYVGWGIVFPRASMLRVASLAAATCVVIECLKLYQASWLVDLRHTTLGHLIFGHVFSWSNLLAYAIGILTASAIETVLLRHRHRDPASP